MSDPRAGQLLRFFKVYKIIYEFRGFLFLLFCAFFNLNVILQRLATVYVFQQLTRVHVNIFLMNYIV